MSLYLLHPRKYEGFAAFCCGNMSKYRLIYPYSWGLPQSNRGSSEVTMVDVVKYHMKQVIIQPQQNTTQHSANFMGYIPYQWKSPLAEPDAPVVSQHRIAASLAFFTT